MKVGRITCGVMVSVVLTLIFVAGSRVSAQGSGGVIRACANNSGSLRVLLPGEACKPTESLLTWNIAGPTGPDGAIGPAGPTGPEGPAGRDGRDAITPPPAASPYSLQMTVDGMNGDNPTPIQAFSLGATNSGDIGGVGGGGGAGKVSFADLHVTKMVDGLSVPLLKATATGLHIQDVKIEVSNIGSGTPFAIYTFTDVLVTSDLLGSSQNSVSESVSFNFAKIASSITLNGMTFTSCYDVKLAKSC